MRRVILVAVVAVTACGGGRSSGPGSAAPAASSAQVTRDFLKAIADSNIARMAELWGTEKGSAHDTGDPPGYEKRLVVIQTWLHADSAKVTSDVGVTGDQNQRQLQVAIYRRGCMKQVPFLAVRARNGGWLIKGIDLAFAGNPARPCEVP